MAVNTTVQISIDNPLSGSDVTANKKIDIGGWAVDTMGTGTGVDKIQVYLDGPMDGGGVLLGNATYGGDRTDVAVALGNQAASKSGFDYVWTPQMLDQGPHVLFVYAHSLVNGWTYSTVNITAPQAINTGSNASVRRGASGGPFDPGPSNTPNGYSNSGASSSNAPFNNSYGQGSYNQGYNNQGNYNQGNYGQGNYGQGNYGQGNYGQGYYGPNNGGYPNGGCNGGAYGCSYGPYGTSFQGQTLCPVYSDSQYTQPMGQMGSPCGGNNRWQIGAPFVGF